MNLQIIQRIWPGSRNAQRLGRTLETFRSELDHRLRQCRTEPDWGKTAQQLLKTAEAFRLQGDTEGAWHCLHAAKRSIISAYSDEERAARVSVLRLDVQKIPSWRRKAVELLIGAEGGPPVSATVLQVAQSILDEYSDNQYHRISLLRDQLRNLVIISLSALALFLVVVSTSPTPLDAAPWNWRVLTAILSFGVLGASFSAARSITSEAPRFKIPEQVAHKWLTLGRTVLGTTPALAAFAFFKSEILDIGPVTFERVLAVAFVAGFSERLVMRAIETIAGKDDAVKPAGGQQNP